MVRRLTIALVAVVTAVVFAPAAGASVDATTAGAVATVRIAPEVAVYEPLLTCASGDLCFWVNADYLGQRGRFAGNNAHWSDFPQPTCPDNNWNDCASSAVNRGTQCTAHLHQHSSYGGDQLNIPRGGNRPHLSAYGFNDKTSSNSWC